MLEKLTTIGCDTRKEWLKYAIFVFFWLGLMLGFLTYWGFELLLRGWRCFSPLTGDLLSFASPK